MVMEQNSTQEVERYELSYMHQKQVMRLIAMSMADDGSVGKREFNEVCRITLEQWPGTDVPSMEVVEKIVRDIKSSLREPSTRQSIFMNIDALTNEDVATEVRNLMRIIVVDNSITDREREAFFIYCRMMRVRNMAQLWRELSKMTLEQLRMAGLNSQYWSVDPLTVKIGGGDIIKGLELSLVGCREGDVVEAYITSDDAYGKDVVGINELCQKVVEEFYSNPNKPKGKTVSVSAGVSSFVPKPCTPFQWEPQDSREEITAKQQLLKDTVTEKETNDSDDKLDNPFC